MKEWREREYLCPKSDNSVSIDQLSSSRKREHRNAKLI